MALTLDKTTGKLVEDYDPDRPASNVTFTAAELNRTPLFSGPQQIEYVKHPEAERGIMRVDRRTGAILKTSDGLMPFPMVPVRLPPELMRRPQPNVHTCSDPGPGNLGCWARSGCTVAIRFELAGLPPPQPHNVILHRDGRCDSHRCFHAYVGVTPSGRPNSQVHLLGQGFDMVIDRTTIPQTMIVNGVLTEVETEVSDLGPEYDEIKAKQAAEKAAREAVLETKAVTGGLGDGPAPLKIPKKRGRPRKKPVEARE